MSVTGSVWLNRYNHIEHMMITNTKVAQAF